MRAWLMDSYRSGKSIVLWLKTPEGELRLERGFSCFIYIDAVDAAERFLQRKEIGYLVAEKLTYLREWKRVFAVRAPVQGFERFVRWIEGETRHRIAMYNADVNAKGRHPHLGVDLPPLAC